MGLDMYLTAKRHVYEWGAPEQKELYQRLNEAFNSPLGSVKSVEIEVAYWRKANAIHRWFVNNVQDGIDECQESEVTRGHLEELLLTIEQVLENHDLAPEKLPATDGFFFGSTDYDEWYFKDLEYTRDTIQKIMTHDPENRLYLYYQASW